MLKPAALLVEYLLLQRLTQGDANESPNTEQAERGGVAQRHDSSALLMQIDQSIRLPFVNVPCYRHHSTQTACILRGSGKPIVTVNQTASLEKRCHRCGFLMHSKIGQNPALG